MMIRTKILYQTAVLVQFGMLIFSALPAARAASAPAKVDSLTSFMTRPRRSGKLNLYASLSANSIEVILPSFSNASGLTVDHADATRQTDRPHRRRGTRDGPCRYFRRGPDLYLADGGTKTLRTVGDSRSSLSAQLKTDAWIATDTQYFIIAGIPIWSKKARSPKVRRSRQSEMENLLDGRITRLSTPTGVGTRGNHRTTTRPSI